MKNTTSKLFSASLKSKMQNASFEEAFKQQSTLLERDISAEHETIDPFSTDWYRDITEKTAPGDRINTERFKASMTQSKLSELTGIPQHHISEMEHDKRPVGRETARKLAKVFKTDYRFFL